MMARVLGSKRRGVVVAFLIAFSACTGPVKATTSTTVDPEDLWPDCDEDMVYYGDGYCDRVTLNTEDCGFDGGDCCECTCVGDGVDPRVICLDDNYECLDTSADCYEEPGPTPAPVVEPPTAVTEDSSAASLSRTIFTTVAATSMFAATALGGAVGLAVA